MNDHTASDTPASDVVVPDKHIHERLTTAAIPASATDGAPDEETANNVDATTYASDTHAATIVMIMPVLQNNTATYASATDAATTYDATIDETVYDTNDTATGGGGATDASATDLVTNVHCTFFPSHLTTSLSPLTKTDLLQERQVRKDATNLLLLSLHLYESHEILFHF